MGRRKKENEEGQGDERGGLGKEVIKEQEEKKNLEDANKSEGREEEEKREQTREISEHTAEKVTEVGGE